MQPVNRNNLFSFISKLILVCCAAWGIYWLVIATLHCPPNAEDFSLAIAPRDHGLIPSVVNLLTFFDSRYTTNFLHGLNPLVFNRVDDFVFMPVICFILLTASFYYFLTSVIDSKNIKLMLAAYSVMFIVVHYALEPSLPYGLFYMVSTFTYIYPWVFTFIWLGSLIRTLHQPDSWKRLLLSLSGYMAIILSYGSSELFISINAFLLLFFFTGVLLYDKAKLKYIIPYGILAFSCMVFIVLCPSGKMYSDKVSTGITGQSADSNFLIESINNYKIFLGQYLLHPLSICFVFVSCFFVARLQVIKRLKFIVTARQLLVLFFFSVLVSYVTTWVFFMVMGTYHDFPKSIYNVVSILVQTGMFVFIPLWASMQLPSVGSKKIFQVAELSAAVLLFLLLLFSQNNISRIKGEYDMGYLQDLKNKTDNFYADVATAKKSRQEHTIVYFQNPEVIPTSVFLRYDVLPNRASACWNIAYEDYFGIDEVRLPGDTVFK